MNHAPSRVYISDVDIHDKLGRGILLGGFHMLVRRSTFRSITNSAIASFMSSYFGESTGISDIAIRDNRITGANYVPKLFQDSADGINSYPNRNASIAMFGDILSSHIGVPNEVTAVYPACISRPRPFQFDDIQVPQDAAKVLINVRNLSKPPRSGQSRRISPHHRGSIGC